MEAGRGQVPSARRWAQLFRGNVPKELSSCVCQPVAWQGWNWEKACWGRAEVAQLGER